VRVRKDGQETRKRILKAALQVFGEKGYRDATHAEICRRAGVNTAAINYHFGSKDGLYQATWEDAASLADALYPIDGGVASDAAPEERLRGLVRTLLQRRADERRLGHFHSIRMMEIVNPTGLLDEAIAAWREKSRTLFLSAIGDILGPDATQTDLEMCEMSAVSQCLMAYKGKRKSIWGFRPDVLDTLAEHIVRFSLAGMRETRKAIENRIGAAAKTISA
jgi:AcrR family transcriptional regulator